MSNNNPISTPIQATTPEPPKRAKPRKLVRNTPDSRPGSAGSIEGGVSLPIEEAKKKRRPRKLNREPVTASTQHEANAVKPEELEQPKVEVLDNEVESLKSRVQNLEAQIQELYNRPVSKGSPRRRGRKNKNSNAGLDPVTETETVPEAPQEAEPEDKELDKLEGDLENAKAELAALERRPSEQERRPSLKIRASSGAARIQEVEVGDDDDNVEEIPREKTPARPSLKTRASSSKTARFEEEDIEEVPRTRPPAVQGRRNSQKQVTLSGNYKIPLPDNVSMEDVRAIQEGVKSAGAFARGLYDASRKVRAKQEAKTKVKASEPAPPPAPSPAPALSTDLTIATNPERKGWGQLLGGYSMAITRFVNNINHEVAMETTNPQPAQASRRQRPTRTRSDGASGATPSPGPSAFNTAKARNPQSQKDSIPSRPKTTRGNSGKA